MRDSEASKDSRWINHVPTHRTIPSIHLHLGFHPLHPPLLSLLSQVSTPRALRLRVIRIPSLSLSLSPIQNQNPRKTLLSLLPNVALASLRRRRVHPPPPRWLSRRRSGCRSRASCGAPRGPSSRRPLRPPAAAPRSWPSPPSASSPPHPPPRTARAPCSPSARAAMSGRRRVRAGRR